MSQQATASQYDYVPFPLGSKVKPKRGPDSKYEWVVYDHHGVTWDRGERTNDVVIVRDREPHEVKHPSDADHCIFKFTTFGRIEAA